MVYATKYIQRKEDERLNSEAGLGEVERAERYVLNFVNLGRVQSYPSANKWQQDIDTNHSAQITTE